MTQQFPQSIMDQIKDAGYRFWIQIYSPLFWIISVLINHWKLQKNNKIIIDDNFLYNNITPSSKKSVRISNKLPLPPPRIVISSSSLQQQQHLSSKHILTTAKSASKKRAIDSLLSPKLKPSTPTPTATTKRKQSSSLFSSLKQKYPHHRPQQHQPRTFFLRRLSSSGSSTSSCDTTKSEPSSPSILKPFSWKLKRQNSDSSLETGHPANVITTNISKQPRISLSHFRKKNIA
jgi:hypothetical protein